MSRRIQKGVPFLFFLCLGLFPWVPRDSWADTTPTMIIEEAKFAIDQARKAGADKVALDDFMAAKSWLSQAEKEYEARKSFFSRIGGSAKEKEEQIIYLGTMAKLKAMTAEAKAKKGDASETLKDARRELADYQSAIEALNKKGAEVEKAREVQAKAEEERKALGEAKKKTAELEEQQVRVLEEAKRRVAELEALKQRELEVSRLEETQRLAKKERELAEARLKTEQMATQQAREAAELRAREEKLAGERDKLAALQKKTQALEREKTMMAEASKIPQATVRSGDQELAITVLAINLFTPATELTPSGRGILDQVGGFLKKYPEQKVVVRGHTDSTGSEAINKTVSEKRAQKVREYLTAYQNVNPALLTAEGVGPSQPAATNATEAGRALNRRVEIAVQTGE